ncbi:phage holin family protein [Blastococcus aggregatus]|uniref:phage holin family protein n=1 Tax=Blastococcus aggregatus TaxID=38502 RepID=UPI001FE76D1E|nr:phage holin family protein [Blastococcus aggregatus]
MAVLVTGCTGSSADEPEASAPASEDSARTAAPAEPLTLLPGGDAVDLALGVSGALFESAPVVVTAREDDRPGLLLAASAAVGLGVPLLVEGSDDALSDELDRLGAGTVLAVGEADGGAAGDGPDVIRVPATPTAVAEATDLSLAEADPVPDDGALDAVAGLDRDEPAALVPDGEEPADGDDVDRVPSVRPGEARGETVVLVGDGDEAVGAVATARAAGAQVVVLEAADPRASEAARAALSDAGTGSVIALGAELAAEEGLNWKLETAASGTELPGGGQLLFPGKMLVALYGHPGTASLGVMGEQPVEAAVQRAREHAAWYEPLAGGRAVVPAFEIITTVASEFPGADGNYSAEADIEVIRPWVEAAEEAGLYVVLDLQPGRTDFVTQAERYRSLLELPHVGLALDPEWRLAPDQVHLTQIGSVGVEEVNRVVAWLADLTREARLPQKLLVLHQFRLDMLPGRELLDTSRDELAVLVHADGQGSQGDKQATWRALHQEAPPVWWGWKNFYDEDAPMLTPEQTMEQVRPAPDLVSYQ